MSEVETVVIDEANSIPTTPPTGGVEEVKTEGSVGFKVEKGDGTVIEGAPTPAEGSPPPPIVERTEVDVKFKIHTPIKEFLEMRSKKMNLPLDEIYGSLIEDAFKMHYNKLCPYCADSKVKWLEERKREYELQQKMKSMKIKRIKKAQKDARKRNRGR